VIQSFVDKISQWCFVRRPIIQQMIQIIFVYDNDTLTILFEQTKLINIHYKITCGTGSDEEKAHKKCKVKVGSTINEAISIKAKQMIAKAHDKVSKAKQDSDTYKKLFAVEEEDATEDGKDKNRLFMIGNPRGYVRC